MSELSVVDWAGLAETIGAIGKIDSCTSERSGGIYTRKAISELIGEDVLLRAVDHVLTLQGGSETAIGVLRYLRQEAVTQYCVGLFNKSDSFSRAQDVVHLLGYIADKSVLQDFSAIIGHADAGVRMHGVRLVDGLWMSGEIEPEEALDLLEPVMADQDLHVVQNAERVIEMLKESIELDSIG